jgi:hypothetical protein
MAPSFFWSTVPANLRPFYERGYKRDGWLNSVVAATPLGFRVAHRLALATPHVNWQPGPSSSFVKVVQSLLGPAGFAFGKDEPPGTFISGWALAPNMTTRPAKAVADGAMNASDALEWEALPVKATAGASWSKGAGTVNQLGEPWSDVIAKQRALEKAAGAEVKKLRLAPWEGWPKFMRDRVAMFWPAPAAPTLALYAFMRDVGLSIGDAKSYLQGKTPPPSSVPKQKPKPFVVTVASGIASAPKGAFKGVSAVIAKPMKPGVVTAAAKAKATPRLSDGEKKALTSAAVIVGGLVIVGGIYVVAKKLGGS